MATMLVQMTHFVQVGTRQHHQRRRFTGYQRLHRTRGFISGAHPQGCRPLLLVSYRRAPAMAPLSYLVGITDAGSTPYSTTKQRESQPCRLGFFLPEGRYWRGLGHGLLRARISVRGLRRLDLPASRHLLFSHHQVARCRTRSGPRVNRSGPRSGCSTQPRAPRRKRRTAQHCSLCPLRPTRPFPSPLANRRVGDFFVYDDARSGAPARPTPSKVDQEWRVHPMRTLRVALVLLAICALQLGLMP